MTKTAVKKKAPAKKVVAKKAEPKKTELDFTKDEKALHLSVKSFMEKYGKSVSVILVTGKDDKGFRSSNGCTNIFGLGVMSQMFLNK